MIIRRMLLLVLGLWLANAAAGEPARFYKWVDEQGRVHYSDAVPPAAAGQEREVKSASGQTVRTIEPPPTHQQLEARRRARTRAKQAERRRRAQKEYDRALLLTFTSVQEIKTARNGRLRAVTEQIELIRQRLDKLRARLREQRRKAMYIERTGRGDPVPVYKKIMQLQRHIDNNSTFIERKLAKRQRIHQEFARAMARYRKLMAERAHQTHSPLGRP